MTWRIDRQLWLALALAAAVIIPRAALISRAHSECIDDEYHLVRGVRLHTGSLRKTPLNDPPVGELISAIPLIASGTNADSPSVLHGQKNSPETLLLRIAIWKAILFLPMVGVAFVWLRRIYNVKAAWFGTILLIFEPNFAAHIHLPAVDILGVEGIFIACYAGWRYFDRPWFEPAMFLGFFIAIALMLKHTALLLPIVVVIYAALWWVFYPASRIKFTRALGHVSLGILICLVSIWVMSAREYAPLAPLPKGVKAPAALTAHPIPAATYVRSLLTGLSHAERGHTSYLFGQAKVGGWWYYFPFALLLKAPLGVLALMLLAIISTIWIRPQWHEWSLAVPACVWTIFMMTSDINIGFRHFLPAYVFMLMLTARVMMLNAKWQIGAWTLSALAAIHGLSFHPDYLSYFNLPYRKPHLLINDSNIDWGQSLKQVRKWLDKHSQTKPVYLRYFGRPGAPNIPHYIGKDVIVLETENNPPRTGILIISPVWEAGVYDADDKYRALRKAPPIAVIGHNLRVYDLDQVKGWRASLDK